MPSFELKVNNFFNQTFQNYDVKKDKKQELLPVMAEPLKQQNKKSENINQQKDGLQNL